MAVGQRGMCPVCSKRKILRPYSFGVLTVGSFEAFRELEMNVCTACVQSSNEIREQSRKILKGAWLAGLFALFGLLQWMMAPTFSFLYSLLFTGGGFGVFVLVLWGKSKERSALEFLVARHPSVLSIKAKGGTVKLLDAEAIKAHT